jgi:chemotaxis protein methyltransferase CheR
MTGAAQPAWPTFADAALDRLADTIKRTAGITLPAHRRSMVSSRLGRRLRELGLAELTDYLPLLADPNGDELATMLDAIVTNKTEFFREPEHFTHLRDVALPTLGQGGEVRILSAGCSSGEEAYSAAMCAHEALGPLAGRVRIDAIDLSRVKLAQARRGIYLDAARAQVGRDRLLRFMLKGIGGSSGLLQVRPEVTGRVEFRRHNLMQPLPYDHRFHAVFCCNVSIYFDQPTQEALFRRLHERLHPGGWLYLGQAESLVHLQTPFQPVAAALYRRAPAGA